MIPPTILQKEDFRFCLVRNGFKGPFEKGWQKTSNYNWSSNKLNEWGENYGVCGGFGGLIVIDFDCKKTQDKLIKHLPKTFTVKTGGSGLLHLYYITNDPYSTKSIKGGKTIFDIQGWGKQVIGPGSKHAVTGKPYTIVSNNPITSVYREFLDGILPNTTHEKKLPRIALFSSNSHKGNRECPLHDSRSGKCLAIYGEKWHCFHCMASGTVEALECLDQGKEVMQKNSSSGVFYYVGRKLPNIMQSLNIKCVAPITQ